jgi:hypothetical protein
MAPQEHPSGAGRVHHEGSFQKALSSRTFIDRILRRGEGVQKLLGLRGKRRRRCSFEIPSTAKTLPKTK